MMFIMSQIFENMYPKELEWNIEHEGNSVPFLDLRLNVLNGKIHYEPYDKRRDFPFEVNLFTERASTVPKRTMLGVINAQIIRFANNCQKPEDFLHWTTRLIKAFQARSFAISDILTSIFRCI